MEERMKGEWRKQPPLRNKFVLVLDTRCNRRCNHRRDTDTVCSITDIIIINM